MMSRGRTRISMMHKNYMWLSGFNGHVGMNIDGFERALEEFHRLNEIINEESYWNFTRRNNICHTHGLRVMKRR